MGSLPIEGWGVAATDLERSFPSWGEPDRVFLVRSERHWTLVTLSLALPLEDGGARLVGRSALSAETFASLDDVGQAVRDRYSRSGWVRLLDAGYDADPDVYCTWAPTRVERDFDQASLHRRTLAAGGPARRVPGWPIEAVAEMGDHLAASGFEVLGCRGLEEADDTDDANPVLGVVDVRRYGFETPAVVRVDDAGEVYVRLPYDDAVERPGLVPVELAAVPEAPSLGW
jgi:hypothetical protein